MPGAAGSRSAWGSRCWPPWPWSAGTTSRTWSGHRERRAGGRPCQLGRARLPGPGIVRRVGMAAVGVAAIGSGWLVVGWARRRFMLITVRGTSMAPTYRNGERLIVRRGGYAAGDVVLFRAPAPHRVQWLVKRAVAVGGDPAPAALLAGGGGSL